MKAAPDTPKLPASIWALGFVSLFMDISSEMVHALLPVFLVSVLGASAVGVGLVEGLGEAVAAIVKLFSGALSDRLGRRKGLVVAGYSLGALSKPLFALAPGLGFVLGARLVDRLGKGLRGAPRDAMIGDLAPPSRRGAAYGLRQSLDTAGAFAGPLLAIALMAHFANAFRVVFGFAIVPALVAVLILIFAVHETGRKAAAPAPASASKPALHWRQVRALGRPFAQVVAIAIILMLARVSIAFLVLRAVGMGLSLTLAPLVFVLMNAVYALTAWPAGALSDRLGRRAILGLGFGVLFLADLVLARAAGLAAVMAGIALWGLHQGLSEGLLASLVADSAPKALRGTAFGVFHLLTGLALLSASLLAGALWQWVSPAASFYAGAGLAALGLLALLLLKPGPRQAAAPG